MIILNFSHPLTDAHLQSIARLTKQEEVPQVIDLPVKFDSSQPFIPQLESLAQTLPLTSRELQTLPILVNLPALNHIAALLIAYLHGVTGHFPSIIRLNPAPDSTPTVFEVAEIINLQSLRDETRSNYR
jgi:hypothetical protein